MEGKDKVVHHNSLKTCVVPVDKGVPFCAVPESAETQILVGDSIIPGENILEGRGNEQPQRVKTEAKCKSPFEVWRSSYSLI